MEREIEKKIKNLKEFIKQKTDQGTANYLGKELREICGMVETEALRIHDVSQQREQLAILALERISKAHSESFSAGVASEALYKIANCG